MNEEQLPLPLELAPTAGRCTAGPQRPRTGDCAGAGVTRAPEALHLWVNHDSLSVSHHERCRWVYQLEARHPVPAWCEVWEPLHYLLDALLRLPR